MSERTASPEPLTREGIHDDPMEQFHRWFVHAREASGRRLPEGFCLSTLDDEGYPDGRIVLLKAYDARGFVFYTNLRSRKGRSLAARPRAALTFWWESLGRQVRAQGDVEPVSVAEADAYFATRPTGSQAGAWASLQSQVLESREVLEARMREVQARHPDGPVPRPPHWSGLRVVPRRVEFWQEGADRLHDRFLYRRENERWVVERLYP